MELKKKQAYNLGIEASRKGIKMIPCFDKKLMELLRGVKVGQASEILNNWTKGYIDRDIIDGII